MLINFLGSPCSGKTTTCARVFADLKDNGYPAEFVTEAARRFIASRPHPVELTPNDQVDIMMQQWESERIMSQQPSLVVCDSSILNGLLYMPEEVRESESVKAAVRWANLNYSVVFLCQTLPTTNTLDPNRVHSLAESQKLEAEFPAILAKYAPEIKPIYLFGNSKYRTQEALRSIYNKLFGHGYGNPQNS